MPSMKITVKQDNTDAVYNTLQSAMLTALTEMGLVAQGYAQDLCPVDTGRLVNSIKSGVISSEKCAYIGTNVEYAAYVELGTSRMAAQPYLKPAVNDHVNEYRDILKNRLENT